tara:strand:- start:2521 stop:2682 length:162 start_codon:yes stop_codon:yes gene_type:complete
MLSSFARCLGCALLLAIIAGWIGLIDFRVCVAFKGGCSWQVEELPTQPAVQEA